MRNEFCREDSRFLVQEGTIKIIEWRAIRLMGDCCRWENNGRMGAAGRDFARVQDEHWGGPGRSGQHGGTFPKVSNPPIVSKPKNPELFQLVTRSIPVVAFSSFTKLLSW